MPWPGPVRSFSSRWSSSSVSQPALQHEHDTASAAIERWQEPRGRPRLEAGGLNAYFGATAAVRDATLPFRDREVTAIIGPSGCGKSTFLRCLNRLHET